MNGWRHTAHDAVCRRPFKPHVGLVGRKCQGHSGPAAQLSAATRVEMSVDWGRAEWLSGLPVVFMIPMKDRGSLVHSFSRSTTISLPSLTVSSA